MVVYTVLEVKFYIFINLLIKFLLLNKFNFKKGQNHFKPINFFILNLKLSLQSLFYHKETIIIIKYSNIINYKKVSSYYCWFKIKHTLISFLFLINNLSCRIQYLLK